MRLGTLLTQPQAASAQGAAQKRRDMLTALFFCKKLTPEMPRPRAQAKATHHRQHKAQVMELGEGKRRRQREREREETRRLFLPTHYSLLLVLSLCVVSQICVCVRVCAHSLMASRERLCLVSSCSCCASAARLRRGSVWSTAGKPRLLADARSEFALRERRGES